MPASRAVTTAAKLGQCWKLSWGQRSECAMASRALWASAIRWSRSVSLRRASRRHSSGAIVPEAISSLGPLLLLGWVSLAVLSAYPVALLILVFAQGAVAFAVGSTLIARVLYAASGAPTMGGSYATAALNVGAAGGPALGAAALATRAGAVGPVWVAVALTTLAVLIALPLLWVIAGPARCRG